MNCPICFRYLVFLFAVLFPIAVLAYIISVVLNSASDQQPNINPPGPRAVDTLKMLVIVSRHGNRVPLYSFPNNPYPLNDSKYWPYGFGELTTFGRIQMHTLGKKVRSLYNGFLDSKYYNRYSYASSTAVDRTLMSGESFLAGLYPPRGFQVWNKNIQWQPTAIYSNSLDKTQVVTSCPRFMQERIDSLKALDDEKNVANFSAVHNYLQKHSGFNLTGWGSFGAIWDTLISEYIEGYTLPDWTKEVFPQPMTYMAGKMYRAYFTATDTMTRFVIGSFFEEVIIAMKRKVNGTLNPDRRMLYYSGHDISLIALQAVLGIPEGSIKSVVQPSSAMVYELHQDKNSTEFSVQVLYIDSSSPDLEPIPLNIPDCSHPCDFNLLVSITQKFTNIQNFDEECQLNFTSNSSVGSR